MNLLAVQRILGLLVMLVSVTMLPPLGVSLYYGDGNWPPFLHAFVALLAVGALIWWPARGRVRELRVRDGFLVVALFWFVVGAAGAVPLLLAEEVQLSVTNAVFESVSGFTTTGATVLSGLDSMPKSLLYYRMGASACERAARRLRRALAVSEANAAAGAAVRNTAGGNAAG